MAQSLVIIPTYNEKENIADLVKAIIELKLALDILIVDDASPDGTGAIADELSRTYNNVSVAHRSGKLGLGTAYIEGFNFGLRRGYRHIMTMDSDFSHHPKYIPVFLALKNDFDIIIGSRYIPGGKAVNWSFIRRLVSFTANFFAKVMLGLTNNDCTAGFRLYRSTILDDRSILQGFHSNGYSFLMEILYKCKQKGARIKEIPITFVDRRVGVSKISRIEVFNALRTLVKFSIERNCKPWLR